MMQQTTENFTSLSPEQHNAVDAYLEASADAKQFSGAVLITQRDCSPISRCYGLANREHQVANMLTTKFRIASVTKQFTAAAILQLQEKGLLDVQAPISNYLTDYPEGVGAASRKENRITVHHLLTHTSGIPGYLRPENESDAREWLRQSFTLAQLIGRFQSRPLDFAPGEKFRYSNSGYVLLTQIIESVANQSYADYLQANIFTPLALNATGYERPQAVIANLAQGYSLTDDGTYVNASPFDMSIPQGAGGLYSTTADLARWTQWLHRQAAESSVESSVLSTATKEMLMQPAVLVEPETSDDTFYGYGIVIDSQFGQRHVHHSGRINGFESSLAHFPESLLTIVVLSNLENGIAFRIAEDLAAIAFDSPYQLPERDEMGM
ncbi:MAG: serine hydrolase domain-containing protein [Cyanobacteria bacterium J06632_3]